MRRLLALLRGRTAPAADAEVALVAATPADGNDVREFVRREVAGGFYDDDAVLRNAVDVFANDYDADTLRSLAQAALRDALRTHRAAQADWPDETDCDRLDAAFDALEALGIVCRQNFTCCGTCGAAEIGEELSAIDAQGFDVRGYAFYHAQDTEAAVDGGGLYLNYGSVEDDDDASIAVGRLIVDELTTQGLTVTWSGDLRQRIAVSLDWKRRR